MILDYACHEPHHHLQLESWPKVDLKTGLATLIGLGLMQ